MLAVFIATLVCLSYGQTYRNWPTLGHDAQLSQFQDDANFTSNTLLAGISATSQVFPTSARESVVYNGVIYYSSKGSLSGFNLATGATVFTTTDIVKDLVPGYSRSNLTSPVLISIWMDKSNVKLVGAFTLQEATNSQVVLFAANLTGGALWHASADSASALSTLLVNEAQTSILLGFESELQSVALPDSLNGTMTSTYTVQWKFPTTGATQPAILPNFVVVYTNSVLSLLNMRSGVVTSSVAINDGGSLAFVTPSFIALSTSTDSIIVSYPNIKSFTPLAGHKILASAPGNTFITYQVSTSSVCRMRQDLSQVWKSSASVSGLIVGSVDVLGLVYVQGAAGVKNLIALQLDNGEQAWALKHSSPVHSYSPIIASQSNHTYLFVDGAAGQVVYTALCANGVTNGFQCTCNATYYGPACNDFCEPGITCNNRGTCRNDATCACDAHYFGASCTDYCEIGFNCMQGTCLSNGVCQCTPPFLGDICNCNSTLCGSVNGTCKKYSPGPEGTCDCPAYPAFQWEVPRGPFCQNMVNLSLIAYIIGIVTISVLCGGICICCACSKRKPAKAGFSMVPTSDVQRH